MRIRSLAVVVLVGLAGIGCTADGDDSRSATAGLPSTRRDLESHEWEVVRPREVAAAGRGATVTFSGSTAAGQGPCGSFRASFSLDDDDDRVSFDHIASSKRACDDPIMRAEASFLRVLEAVDHVEVDDDGDELELSGPATHLVLRAAAPQPTTERGSP